MEKYSNSYIQLSVNRALIGLVTENFRAVTVGVGINEINIIFYFSTSMNEEENENVSEITTEVLSDFDSNYSVKSEIVSNDDKINTLKILDFWIFRRYED